MDKVKNIENFNLEEVKKWNKADFIKVHKPIYENAEEIYDYCFPKKKKAKSDDE